MKVSDKSGATIEAGKTVELRALGLDVSHENGLLIVFWKES